ncbi:MAG: tetratricopeptide repeat protein, partial [Chloroflexi bacterium]|nr:tetratricopeptide repeat protein [Chloroflexota bacterium]
DVAAALHNLAQLHQAQGRYAEAEPLYRRSLMILESALGLEHPYVVAVLQNTAKRFREMGNGEEAQNLEARADRARSRW